MADLSNIQELIERTIYENIRTNLVALGYLPDVTLFADTEAGAIAYKAAFDAIVTAKGYVVEVFNESSNYDKGNKKVPRIVIESGNFLPGVLGGDPAKFFIDQGDTFQANVLPTQTADFYLDIHLISNNVSQERFLNSLLAISVPRRKYITWYSDPTKTFFIRNTNYRALDDMDHGVIEKVFSYEVPDCWDRGNEVSDTDVAKILEITFIQKLQKYLSDSITTSTDTTIIT